jgi:hypothetical protein
MERGEGKGRRLQGREGGRRDTHARPPQRIQEASLELCLVSEVGGKGREGRGMAGTVAQDIVTVAKDKRSLVANSNS